MKSLWELGIGLTDIAKHVYGMDHQLPKRCAGARSGGGAEGAHPESQARILAFTSLNGGRKVMGPKAVAGEQPQRLGETRVFILPSPSPLAANHWDIKPWRDLARAVKALDLGRCRAWRCAPGAAGASKRTQCSLAALALHMAAGLSSRLTR